MKRALGFDSLYVDPDFVWEVQKSEWCSLASALAYVRPASHVDSEVDNPPPASLSFLDVYDIDLDAEGELDWPDILLSGEIDVCFSWHLTFTVFTDKYVEYFFEARTTAAGAFKLALSSSHTNDEQQELLACVDQFHTTIRLYKA